MCGGAIISDLIAAKRGRNLSTQDLWSELDADLLSSHSLSSSPKSNSTSLFSHQTTLTPQLGNIFCLHLLLFRYTLHGLHHFPTLHNLFF